MLSRQSQVNRNWKISRIERLATSHHVQNYQRDVQDLKCQGENIRNCKLPFILLLIYSTKNENKTLNANV